MPNWCCNCEIIAGPKEEVKKLRDLIEEWTSKNYVENGFGLEWLGNIVIGAGFTIYDDDPVNGFYCRGNLSDALEIEEGKDGEDWELHFQSLTACGPMPQMWYAIVAKYAPHCKYYYYSEEHGNQLYESNDVEHRFFPEEYFVDVMYYEDDKAPEKIKKYFPESSYEYSTEQIVSALQDILETDEENVDKLVDKFYEKDFLKDIGFVYINKIVYEI